ncbi:MAG TPA: OpgC domain-containing protein, partial [Arthrobacter sp.]|nr:OpgC domain-containing protein [Arthrobacter sp.]
MRAHVSHHHAASRRNRPRSAAAFLAAVLIAFLAVVAPASPAQAAGPTPDKGKPWLGAVLEWGEDTAAGFSDRLGASPALFGHDITIPYRESERNDIEGFLQQTAAKGAHAMLTVKPSVPLDQLGTAEAEAFAAQVHDLTSGFKGQLLVRFAPDMNASWVAWGQQPATYRQAFQAVAAAFKKDDGGGATMVWAPYLGKDYPFDRNRNAPQPGSDGFALLDTNGDGTWNGSDSA